jgi:hypothetical protein
MKYERIIMEELMRTYEHTNPNHMDSRESGI